MSLEPATIPAVNNSWLYWGKARPAEGSEAKFHLLPYHCLDVSAVAAAYLGAAPGLRRWLASSFGVASEQDMVAWVSFWMCLHDLGKFAEAFQGQRSDIFHDLRGRAPRKAYNERHDTLGRVAWTDLLEQVAIDESWMGPQTEDYLPGLNAWVRAVTGHHGQPPKSEKIYLSHHFDASQDCQAIVAFVRDARLLMVGDSAPLLPTSLDADGFSDASERLSWWIAGLAVLADWIGSNTEYFEYCDHAPTDGRLDAYWEHAQRRASVALAATGVLPGAAPCSTTLAALFPDIAKPSPLQAWARDQPLPAEPTLIMLEDITGAGKTEAAVLLAHRMMSSGLADGFFVGLPTMATANAMYGRISAVFGRLFGANDSLALAHGQSRLVEDFAATVLRAGRTESDTAQHDETASARCTAWLADHNKRALMAAAGVGTIDQAMLGVLHSKHQSLRLLGLFRKVLIVDEVHACDSYMQRVLESLLEFHAYAGGSAILLSATLPQAMKQALLGAYARGRALAQGKRARLQPLLQSDDYPLATTWHESIGTQVIETRLASRVEVSRSVAVRFLSNEGDVVEAIMGALGAGRCVCWIRNTVADALAAFDELAPRIGSDHITLFHARFALADRLQIEKQMLNRFGPKGFAELRRGQLVVATQVVEQSLDADWDVVVTDLAPIDRLIQRAGRLQRHVRDARGDRLLEAGSRDQRGEPCLWVFGPEWADTPEANWFKAAFPKAASVYRHHGQLWLTMQVMQAGRFRMPEDARYLIKAVYGEDAVVPDALTANANRAEGEHWAARSQGGNSVVKLISGYTRGDVIDWWSEARTPSRLGEASTTVMLARWDGDHLRPWCEHANEAAAWAYSSVRVATRSIASRAVEPTPQREAAVCAVEAALPGAGKWAVLLPLEQGRDGVWRGHAMTGESKHRAGEVRAWAYCSSRGLVPAKQGIEEDSE
ncbi:MAG: CRISPR-associated helicase Cas3' [Ramlibacter sp.]|nr:CRISPR-associated helicase Cas3' [Ramlibacter sp.]